MTRLAYYNEIDPMCCDVLRALVADGSLPNGDVDQRDVRLVDPSELRAYGQIHLFAGIGGGPLACRLAGMPDDFRIVTAGVPCQPSSQAGKRLGAADERWLWPEYFRLLRGLGFHYSLVEQPPGILSLNDGREWNWILGTMAEIREDFEVSRVSAEAVGAPHERDRLWIVAYPDAQGRIAIGQSERAELQGASRCVVARRDESLGHSDGGRREQCDTRQRLDSESRTRFDSMGYAASGGRRAGREIEIRRSSGEREDVGVTVGESAQHAGIAGDVARAPSRDEGEGLQRERRGRATWNSGDGIRPWDDAVAVIGCDGTTRLIPAEAAQAGPESSLWPVADGLPGRVARLRAIGNAWVPQAAIPALRVILAHDAQLRSVA